MPIPSRSRTTSLRRVPCTGTSPSRVRLEIVSGPAHNVDVSPPSRASVAITKP